MRAATAFVLLGMCGAYLGCAPTVAEKDRAGAKIRYDIGVASLNQGDLRTALRELLGAVEADPELAEAHHALGIVFHAMGRPEDALVHYRRAIELKPKFSEAHNNMGGLLMELKRYDEAIAAFQVALSDILYATPSYAEGNMGWAYYNKGESDRALRHLRNAVATNPKFCRGYGWLTQIELERNKPDQVVAYGMRFKKHCMEDENVAAKIPAFFVRLMHYYLARGYLGLGERGKAAAALRVCVEGGAEDEISIKCERLKGSAE